MADSRAAPGDAGEPEVQSGGDDVGALGGWEARIAAVLRALHLDSIKNKIVVLALLATLIPAFSTAFLSYTQNRRALAEKLENELRSTGSQTARELDLWIKERFYDVRVFVSSFEVSENLERIPQGGGSGVDALTRLNNYLSGVQRRFTDYSELSVLDGAGRPVASSAAAPTEVELPEAWWARLEQGETFLGEPYWDAARAEAAATLAVPIQTANGRYLGVLRATLTFEAVHGILEGFAPGDAGRVYLVTADGRAIVDSGEADTRGLELALDADALARMVDGPGATLEYAGLTRTPVVGTITPVPGRDWAVVAEIPRAEAFAQITQLRNATFAVVSALLVVVGFIAYLLGLFIVRPLARLTSGARAVAGGDMSVDVPVTGGGEVGYLTEVFNDMVGRLRRGREELDRAYEELQERNDELERISTTDALTGLHNRRYMMDAFEKELQRARRNDRRLAVLMIDVDRFKQYNDTYGHQAGDEVLAGVGQVLLDATRDLDVCARYGGEEFIVLLPECDLEGALDAAGRIRSRLAEEVFEGGAVTASIGAAEYGPNGESPGAMIAAADEALYEAKRQGRDRVVGAAPQGGGAESAAAEAGAGSDVKTAPETGAAKRRPGGKAPAKKKATAKKKAAAKKKAPAERKAAKKKAGAKKKAAGQAESDSA